MGSKTNEVDLDLMIFDGFFVHFGFRFNFRTVQVSDQQVFKINFCGAVGRAAASDTRDPGFKTRHQRNLIFNCTIEMTKIKKKRPGMAHL